jgi:ADP-ribose pyrophosphatase YjhB (NUDIX family)
MEPKRKTTLEQLTQLPECCYRVSVKALIRDSEGRVLVVKEDDDYWDLPGGGTDHDEDLEVSLKREIREEVGLEVEVGNLYDSIKFVSVDGIHALFVIYECHPTGSLVLRLDEASEAAWLPAAELTSWPLNLIKDMAGR